MEFDCDFIVEKLVNTHTGAKISKEELPIKMMFWVDPNWEGIWVDDFNPKSQSPCSLFRLQRKEIQRLPKSTLNPRKNGETEENIPTVNSSVKLQFFTDPKRNTNTPDFQFMSACPLHFFFKKKMFRLGLWNYNIQFCDETGMPMPDYLLTVLNRKCQIQNDILIKTPKKIPRLEHHQLVLKIDDWINRTLQVIFPEEETIFKNLRTYCRGAWMATFFFDLHKLYETDEGTNLPPIMALYIVCNACLLHRVTPCKFLRMILSLKKTDSAPSNDREKRLMEQTLTMVHDIILCFTMCQREGKYRDDKSIGNIVEDQPFLLAFRSCQDYNVFDEDDCEGHDQHGCVHVKGLFRHIAKDARENNLINVLQHIGRVGTESCLQITDAGTMHTLLQICVNLGEMFETKQLDAIMSVGEANFASFSQVNAKGKVQKDGTRAKKTDAHSFGLLIFKDIVQDQIIGSIILETTGWENRGFSRQQQSRESLCINKEIVKFAMTHKNEPKNSIKVRCILNKRQEDALYLRVFAGDNCIFFTVDKEGGSLRLQYGASPSNIFKYAREYKGESREKVMTWMREKDSMLVVLVVSPENFFRALSQENSPWGKHSGAEECLKHYLTVKEVYPSFHQCLMPPQVNEAEFLRKMTAFWGEIGDHDLSRIQDYPVEEEGLFEKTIAFSCIVNDRRTRAYSEHIRQFISKISQVAEITEHNFMHSKLFVARPFNSTEF